MVLFCLCVCCWFTRVVFECLFRLCVLCLVVLFFVRVSMVVFFVCVVVLCVCMLCLRCLFLCISCIWFIVCYAVYVCVCVWCCVVVCVSPCVRVFRVVCPQTNMCSYLYVLRVFVVSL